MGGSPRRLIFFLGVTSFLASYLETLYGHTHLTLDRYFLFLFLFWFFFIGGYSFFFFLLQEEKRLLQRRFPEVNQYAPALEIKVLKEEKMLPRLLLPKPFPKSQEKDEKEEDEKATSFQKHLEALKSKEGALLASMLKNLWLT